MNNKVVTLLAVLVFCLLGWNTYLQLVMPRTGYVLIQDVYNDFDLKEEMEQKFLNTKNARDKLLDSLALEVTHLGKEIEREGEKNSERIKEFNIKREEYYQKRETFEQDNNALSKQYDHEILTQLNQYVKDYGKEKGYTYIYGNDGTGSLMYGKATKDITKEVIEFINNKYSGIK